MHKCVLVLPVLFAFLVGAAPASAWTWPVKGPVLAPFIQVDDPYAAGQHRGIDVGADTGSTVSAPSAGTVTFAGSVPGGGKTVTILTADGYAVTLVHLGSITVSRGSAVQEGQAVGTVGPSGVPEHAEPYLHLGVRVAADDHGYVDPLSLLPVGGNAGGSESDSETPAGPADENVPPAVSSPTPAEESAASATAVTDGTAVPPPQPAEASTTAPSLDIPAPPGETALTTAPAEGLPGQAPETSSDLPTPAAAAAGGHSIPDGPDVAQAAATGREHASAETPVTAEAVTARRAEDGARAALPGSRARAALGLLTTPGAQPIGSAPLPVPGELTALVTSADPESAPLPAGIRRQAPADRPTFPRWSLVVGGCLLGLLALLRWRRGRFAGVQAPATPVGPLEAAPAEQAERGAAPEEDPVPSARGMEDGSFGIHPGAPATRTAGRARGGPHEGRLAAHALRLRERRIGRPMMRPNDVLRDDSDLLRELEAAHRARVHDDRR
jgi:hypothetical protein